MEKTSFKTIFRDELTKLLAEVDSGSQVTNVELYAAVVGALIPKPANRNRVA